MTNVMVNTVRFTLRGPVREICPSVVKKRYGDWVKLVYPINGKRVVHISNCRFDSFDEVNQ